MNLDNAYAEYARLLDSSAASEEEAVELHVLIFVADGMPVDDMTQQEAIDKLRAKGLL